MSEKIREGWGHLSEEARDELLELRYGPKEMSPEELSEYTLEEFSVKIRPTTLSRRLRGWKKEATEEVEEGISISEEGENIMEVVSTGSNRIKTINDLIEATEIDLEEWQVTDSKVKTYEGYRRNEDKNLVFDEGRISGHIVDEGKLTVVPLFSVRATFVKRQPTVVDPSTHIVPIQFPEGLRKKEKANHLNTKTRKTLVIADPHFGFERDLRTNNFINYHDRNVLDLALQVAEEEQPDEIVFNGDLLDLAEWSDKFARSPEMKQTTQPALIEAGWWLRQFRTAVPHARIVVMEGNHEIRMNRMLISSFQQAYQLQRIDNLDLPPALSVPYLLALDSMDIEWVGNYPNELVWLSDQIAVGHGNTTSSKPGYTSGKIVDDAQYTVVTGHIHRIERASKTLYLRDEMRFVKSFSSGCACRIDGVVPAGKEQNNWQNGFTMIEYSEEFNELDDVDSIEVVNGRMLYKGKVWEAREETLRSMESDTPWRLL